jgi:VanZ family protein
MTIILRTCAWLWAAAVTFVSLSPPRYRPDSHLGHGFEHALAFVLVGLAFGFAYPKHRRLATTASVIAIGIIEMLQLLIPGRHARLEDFLVNALATCAGLAIVALFDWAAQRLRWRTKTLP